MQTQLKVVWRYIEISTSNIRLSVEALAADRNLAKFGNLLSSLSGPHHTFLAYFDIINTETGLDNVLISFSDFEHWDEKDRILLLWRKIATSLNMLWNLYFPAPTCVNIAFANAQFGLYLKKQIAEHPCHLPFGNTR